MSELSEQVRQSMDRAAKMLDGADLVNDQGMVDAKEAAKVVPMHDEFRAHAYHENIRALRPIVREFGGVTWNTPKEAFDAVRHQCVQACLPNSMRFLAHGVLMGRKPSPVIKKYKVLGQMDKLFESEGFRADIELESLRFIDDADTRYSIERFVVNSVYLTGALTGFSRASSSHFGMVELSSEGSGEVNTYGLNPNRIFDLWSHSMGSLATSFYISGIELGQRWDEDEILGGIMSASTDQEQA